MSVMCSLGCMKFCYMTAVLHVTIVTACVPVCERDSDGRAKVILALAALQNVQVPHLPEWSKDISKLAFRCAVNLWLFYLIHERVVLNTAADHDQQSNLCPRCKLTLGVADSSACRPVPAEALAGAMMLELSESLSELGTAEEADIVPPSVLKKKASYMAKPPSAEVLLKAMNLFRTAHVLSHVERVVIAEPTLPQPAGAEQAVPVTSALPAKRPRLTLAPSSGSQPAASSSPGEAASSASAPSVTSGQASVSRASGSCGRSGKLVVSTDMSTEVTLVKRPRAGEAGLPGFRLVSVVEWPQDSDFLSLVLVAKARRAQAAKRKSS